MNKTTSHYTRLALAILMISLFSCGGGSVNGNGDGGNGSIIDSRPIVDAYIDPNCVPGLTECTDCIDNDSDGVADGADPECTSAADDDEGSFATGIPGDNKDPNKQDCFFDGDSGEGNDGCDIATCCILGTCTQGEDCSVTQTCIDYCLPATTPGCDCFGCCTICKDGTCYDVATSPAISPNCTYEVIEDETKCLRCTQSNECVNSCDSGNQEDCILCPGELAEDLPSHCGGEIVCPVGSSMCVTSDDCPKPDAGLAQFCSQGCCIDQVG